MLPCFAPGASNLIGGDPVFDDAVKMTYHEFVQEFNVTQFYT